MSLLDRLLGRRRGSKPSSSDPSVDRAGASMMFEAALGRIRTALDGGDAVQARSELNAVDAAWLGDPELQFQQGRCERLEGRWAEALLTQDAVLPATQRPGLVQLEMGLCHIGRNDVQSARDCLEVAVTLEPELGTGWSKLGEMLYRLQDPGALQAFRQAIRFQDEPSEAFNAWFRIGQLEFLANDVQASSEAFEAALKLRPDSIEAMTAVADTAVMLDREDEAMRYYEQALELSPNLPRNVLTNMSAALHYCGRYDEGARVLQRILVEYPNDHVARCYLGQLQLARCHWTEGWRNFASRYSSGAVPYRPMPYPQWAGQRSPDGTLLVLADEGIGDEIMYASCLADAAERVGTVIVECERRLHGLFRRSFPQIHVVATQRENDSAWLDGLTRPDWQIPASELPALFRQRDEDFPAHAGYLKADPSRVQYWRSRLQTDHVQNLKVGISWRGGTPKTRGRARTIAPEHWKEILSQQDVAFINLQYGKYQQELAALNDLPGVHVHDYPDALADYDETAALVASLDLVVTVCTAVVHLAGALGKPVWILTPLAPGWRYTTDRLTMPWYPSSVIFRQRELGQWDSACRELAVRLCGLTNSVTQTDPVPLIEGQLR